MPTQKSAVPPEVYQLKVTLLGSSPLREACLKALTCRVVLAIA